MNHTVCGLTDRSWEFGNARQFDLYPSGCATVSLKRKKPILSKVKR